MTSGKTGAKPTDHAGATESHYLGAAGEHLVASYYLIEGHPVFFPLGQANWIDLMVALPHGAHRVQVKTTAGDGSSVRVRNLGSDFNVQPSDRYDVLAVVNWHRLWLIPASALGNRDNITIHTQDDKCPFAGYRKR